MKDNNKNKENKKEKKLMIGLIILLIVLVVATIGTAIYLKQNDNKEEKELAYTELIKEISYGNIEKVEMTVGSTTVKVKIKNEEKEKTTIVPNTEAFMDLIQQKVAEGNEIELIQKPRSAIAQIGSVIVSLLPTMIMVALFIMIFKMQGLGEKGKVYEETERKTKVKFDDVAGLD